MKISNKILVSAGIIIAFLPVLLFRRPANTVRSGNDLSTLSWLLADSQGQGTWQLYPITITITIGEWVTFATITNCGRTTQPNERLSEYIPFPLDYTHTNNTVSIIFNEVP